MYLARAWRNHPTELRADLQRYYGVNWDTVLAGSVSFLHAAALAVCLPLGSRLLACEDPCAEWTNAEILLLTIANSLRKEPIDPFKTTDATAMDIDVLDEYLSRARESVNTERG